MPTSELSPGLTSPFRASEAPSPALALSPPQAPVSALAAGRARAAVRSLSSIRGGQRGREAEALSTPPRAPCPQSNRPGHRLISLPSREMKTTLSKTLPPRGPSYVSMCRSCSTISHSVSFLCHWRPRLACHVSQFPSASKTPPDQGGLACLPFRAQAPCPSSDGTCARRLNRGAQERPCIQRAPRSAPVYQPRWGLSALGLFLHSQRRGQAARGGRSGASCLPTLMSKRVEHSQATELC